MPRVAATPILKTIKQGMANATHNLRLDPKTLVLKNILVDEGRSAKRMDKSHGSRFDRGIIHKRSSNITVILESKEAKNGAKS
jgi:ribosomal protein L22